jgi:hypothetical protein
MRGIPWAGLAALILMFLLPLLPSWIFEGPRKVRHWPHRHICACCNSLWTEGHVCAVESTDSTQALRGELRRVQAGTDLERHGEPPRLL